MKKFFSLVAIALMSMSFFSCQPESTTQETDALYQNIGDMNASDGDDTPIDGRDQ